MSLATAWKKFMAKLALFIFVLSTNIIRNDISDEIGLIFDNGLKFIIEFTACLTIQQILCVYLELK